MSQHGPVCSHGTPENSPTSQDPSGPLPWPRHQGHAMRLPLNARHSSCRGYDTLIRNWCILNIESPQQKSDNPPDLADSVGLMHMTESTSTSLAEPIWSNETKTLHLSPLLYEWEGAQAGPAHASSFNGALQKPWWCSLWILPFLPESYHLFGPLEAKHSEMVVIASLLTVRLCIQHLDDVWALLQEISGVTGLYQTKLYQNPPGSIDSTWDDFQWNFVALESSSTAFSCISRVTSLAKAWPRLDLPPVFCCL
jgi:hypothetical protein